MKLAPAAANPGSPKTGFHRIRVRLQSNHWFPLEQSLTTKTQNLNLNPRMSQVGRTTCACDSAHLFGLQPNL